MTPSVSAEPATSPNSDVQSVVLAIRILEALARAEGSVGVTQLADELGVTKARVHRHLRTLHRIGSVIQDPRDERYLLGLRPFMTAPPEGRHHAMRAAARGSMASLAEESGLSVVLSARTDQKMVIIEIARPGRGIEVSAALGELLDYGDSIQGAAAVASMAPDERARVLGQSSTTEKAAEYERIAERGWSAGHVPTEGINILAAPILMAPNAPIGTVALVASVPKLPLDPPHELIVGITSVAQSIGLELRGETDDR